MSMVVSPLDQQLFGLVLVTSELSWSVSVNGPWKITVSAVLLNVDKNEQKNSEIKVARWCSG